MVLGVVLGGGGGLGAGGGLKGLLGGMGMGTLMREG